METEVLEYVSHFLEVSVGTRWAIRIYGAEPKLLGQGLMVMAMLIRGRAWNLLIYHVIGLMPNDAFIVKFILKIALSIHKVIIVQYY